MSLIHEHSIGEKIRSSMKVDFQYLQWRHLRHDKSHDVVVHSVTASVQTETPKISETPQVMKWFNFFLFGSDLPSRRFSRAHNWLRPNPFPLKPNRCSWFRGSDSKRHLPFPYAAQFIGLIVGHGIENDFLLADESAKSAGSGVGPVG